MDKEPYNLAHAINGELYKQVKSVLEAKNLDIYETYTFPRKGKDRFISCVWVLKQSIDRTNLGEAFEIDEKLYAELKTLLASLMYLVNSTSFKIGKYQDFDKFEIDRKLNRRRKNEHLL